MTSHKFINVLLFSVKVINGRITDDHIKKYTHTVTKVIIVQPEYIRERMHESLTHVHNIYEMIIR